MWSAAVYIVREYFAHQYVFTRIGVKRVETRRKFNTETWKWFRINRRSFTVFSVSFPLGELLLCTARRHFRSRGEDVRGRRPRLPSSPPETKVARDFGELDALLYTYVYTYIYIYTYLKYNVYAFACLWGIHKIIYICMYCITPIQYISASSPAKSVAPRPFRIRTAYMIFKQHIR